LLGIIQVNDDQMDTTDTDSISNQSNWSTDTPSYSTSKTSSSNRRVRPRPDDPEDLLDLMIRVTIDSESKFRQYELDANLGDTEAQFNLAECFLYGRGVTKSIFDAVGWYRKSADNGNLDAMVQLGNCYYEAKKIKKEEAMMWCRKAAEEGGVTEAMFNLVCHLNDFPISSILQGQNIEQGIDWLTKAADLQHEKSMFAVGNYYRLHKNINKAIEWYSKLEKTDPKTINLGEIHLRLGSCYFYEAEEKNVHLGLDYFIKATNEKNSSAKFILGKIYFYGTNGIPKNFIEAQRLMLDAAHQGHSQAQFTVGVCYRDGIIDTSLNLSPITYLQRDLVKATEWLQKAVDQSDYQAMNALGEILLDGSDVVPKDENAAFKLFCESSLSLAKASFNLGCCYYKGSGITVDYARAVSSFNEAVRLGYVDANLNLGKCYQLGHGVSVDTEKAIDCYLKAKSTTELESLIELLKNAQGDENAQICLAKCYLYGHGVREQDTNKAINLLKTLAERENPDAQYILGLCFENSDFDEAFTWFQRSSKQNHYKAINKLGECYRDQKGTQKNLVEAAKCFQVSATHDKFAQYNLAECYFNGDGLERDYALALQFYQYAAGHEEESHQDGKDAVEKMVKLLESEASENLEYTYVLGKFYLPRDEKKAFQHFLNAQDDPRAQYHLGLCYQNGKGIQRDPEKAVHWYKRAAEKEIPEAEFKLGECYHTGYGGLNLDIELAEFFYRKAESRGDLSATAKLETLHGENFS
jgi:TPR repeat protein